MFFNLWFYRLKIGGGRLGSPNGSDSSGQKRANAEEIFHDAEDGQSLVPESIAQSQEGGSTAA